MCNLYRMTSNADAMRRLFKVASPTLPNPPVYTEILPDKDAPIVRDVAGGREIAIMRWGFPPPIPGNRSVTNVRKLSSKFWRTALSYPERRCLVPVTAFSEWAETPGLLTVRGRKAWFDLPARPLFAFAGVWRPTAEVNRFAILTTMANAFASDVQLKAMPMILAEDEQEQWLSGTFAQACALSDAYPDAELRMLP